MKDRYDGVKGKESASMNSRMSRLNAEHSSNNAFVKSKQAEVAGMGGKNPSLSSDCMKFDSHMMNTGEHAQSFAGSLTAGLDKKAFPVK